jgi:hypothetical protein
MLQPVPRLPQHVVQSRLDEWRRLLRSSTTQSRAVLQRVIRGRITFTPTQAVVCSEGGVFPFQPGYEFEAPTRFDKLFSGTAIKLPATAPYTGQPTPEYACVEDADYGALLERAQGGREYVPNGKPGAVLSSRRVVSPHGVSVRRVRRGPSGTMRRAANRQSRMIVRSSM